MAKVQIAQPRIQEAEEMITGLCERAIRLAPAEFPPTLPPSKVILGAPEWHAFEHEAWPLGEQIRLLFSGNKRLRINSAFSQVAEVAVLRNLRRGRQSFVLALGFPEAREFASMLVGGLSDADVDGQVVDTLLKMKAAEFAHQVRPLVNSEKTWIRRLAVRYVDRLS